MEGTGSYGAGLASFLRRQAITVHEVSGVDRHKRRRDGKDDTLDAESAARAVLAGTALAVPKAADGASEMVRQIKIARDTAVKARSANLIALKTFFVNAPSDLRERLEPLSYRALIAQCAAHQIAAVQKPADSVMHSVRAMARRWRFLKEGIASLDALLDELTTAGDNPARIRSEGAFAKLCGACPIRASSGVTHRHRLSRGGHRRANAALYHIVIVRLRWHQATIEYATRRYAEGLSKRDIIACLKRFVAHELYMAA